MTPQFDTLNAFIAMGEHGAFVWGAWGLTALVIAGLAVRAGRAQVHWRARVDVLEAEAKARSEVA
jgi:heme exporter protein D